MRTLPRLGLAVGLVTAGLLILLALASYVSADSSDSGSPNAAVIWVAADRQSASTYAPACTPDLVITMTVIPSHLLQPGDALTYIITYLNNSPDPAPYVMVIDRLPNGIKRTGSSSIPNHEPPIGADPVWIWSIGTVGAGQGGVITLRAVVDTGIPWGQLTTVTNRVTILGVTRDCNSANNSYSVTSSVVPGNPYAMTLTSVPGTIPATGTALVTATVRDRWGNLVRDGTPITFTADSLGTFVTGQPRWTIDGVATSTFQAGAVAGVSIVTATTATARGTGSITITSYAAYKVTLQADPAYLIPDGVSTSVITATIVDPLGNPVADGTRVDFFATLGTVSTPHVTANGQAVATFTAGSVAGTATVTATAQGRSNSIRLTLGPGYVDLSSSVKLASTDVITRVGPLTYTFILTNSGNLVAANVVLTDPIPLGTVFVPGSPGGGAIYNPSLDQIEWSGPAPKGGSVRLSFAVTVTIIEPATIVNHAHVSLNGVPDRILTASTRIIPSSPAWNIYLPLIMRDSSS